MAGVIISSPPRVANYISYRSLHLCSKTRAWNWHLVVPLSQNRLPWHRWASPSATLDGSSAGYVMLGAESTTEHQKVSLPGYLNKALYNLR